MEKDQECPVCFENLSRSIQTIFPCHHPTCLNCLAKMQPPLRCPLCRFDLTPHLPEKPLHLLNEPTTPSRESRRTTLSFMIQRHASRRFDGSPTPLNPRLSSRGESMLFEMSSEASDDPSVVATLRTRPVQAHDLPNARVTRNSIYVRNEGGE